MDINNEIDNKINSLLNELKNPKFDDILKMKNYV